MAQIQKGSEYFDGMQVTASNLNALVDNAILLDGAINDQNVGNTLYTDNAILANESSLKKVTVANLLQSCVKINGSSAMTEELILSGATVTNAFSATPKIYVDTTISAATAGIIPSTIVRSDGSKAMTAELTLSSSTPTSALSAASKGYVDSSSGAVVPVGAIMAFYRSTAPSGWLECNGQLTSGYTALQALIGSNVPDLRGQFVRGWDNGLGVDSGRAIGSTQVDLLGAHTHTATSEAHTHTVTDPGHTHVFSGTSHTHSITDPGHVHGLTNVLRWPQSGTAATEQNQEGNPEDRNSYSSGTNTGFTGISIAAATTGGTNASKVTGITNQNTTTSITVNSSVGIETRPKNVAFMYCIKT